MKSVNFSALATSDIKISLFFGDREVDKPTKLVRLMNKKSSSPKKKAGK